MDIKLLIIWVLTFAWVQQIYAADDSLGIVSMNKEKFIVYKVDYGQNLFSLAKRFNVSVMDIKKANGDTLNELKFEQLILVPIIKKPVVLCEKRHVIKKGETLYSIARKYQVGMEEIRTWNHLQSDDIKPKDALIIFVEGPCQDIDIGCKKEPPDQKKNNDDRDFKKTEKNLSINDSVPDNERISVADFREEGAGTWMDWSDFDKKKNLALHKDAPIGTLIKLVNIMNGKIAYVKVVGRLPEKEVKLGHIIVISKFTADKLNIRDKNFRVKLYYTKSSITAK